MNTVLSGFFLSGLALLGITFLLLVQGGRELAFFTLWLGVSFTIIGIMRMVRDAGRRRRQG